MGNKVVVAGGGASGLTAAIFAARHGAQVTVLEHKDRVGKKLLMTGNGKCNLTNMSDVHGKYYSSNAASLNKIYDTLVRFDAVRTREFFKELGLFTKEKRDGGIYPVSEQASVVLDVLRSACSQLGVQVMTDCELYSVSPMDTGGGQLGIQHCLREDSGQGKKHNHVIESHAAKSHASLSQKEKISYDRLILATGGKAAALTGSDGSGYMLAKSLGHSIIEPLPALVQLRCAGNFFKAVSGIRAQSRLELFVDGKLSSVQEGELQLTDYGISGIPVFQFSRIAARALYDDKKCDVKIDFVPYLSQQDKELLFCTMERFQYKAAEEFLAGLVHKKLAALVCKRNGICSGMTVKEAGVKKIRACMKELESFWVQVIASNSFENAQVCSGGIPLSEVDNDFQSVLCTHVYLVGELLDCDGICGGYNLQWAWATGAIAGKAAAD